MCSFMRVAHLLSNSDHSVFIPLSIVWCSIKCVKNLSIPGFRSSILAFFHKNILRLTGLWYLAFMLNSLLHPYIVNLIGT
jgi:hypothetical protein